MAQLFLKVFDWPAKCKSTVFRERFIIVDVKSLEEFLLFLSVIITGLLTTLRKLKKVLLCRLLKQLIDICLRL